MLGNAVSPFSICSIFYQDLQQYSHKFYIFISDLVSYETVQSMKNLVFYSSCVSFLFQTGVPWNFRGVLGEFQGLVKITLVNYGLDDSEPKTLPVKSFLSEFNTVELTKDQGLLAKQLPTQRSLRNPTLSTIRFRSVFYALIHSLGVFC